MTELRDLVLSSELEDRKGLLQARGLSVPTGEGTILGAFEGDRLVGTGSLIGSVIQGVAVEPELEGEGVAVSLISSLISRAVSLGMGHLFLFTKPSEERSFVHMGFSPVASVEGASLLEWGRPGIEDFCSGLRAMAPGRPCGAVVVNCNPFTLGHRWLIERASQGAEEVFVMVVEEDRSVFPFADRFKLVKDGVADLSNVTVIPSGPYVISSATFPTYFTKGGEASSVHASLDLTIFATKIAPPLGVVRRFVGSEPICPLTGVYNSIMKETLPPLGIEVVELQRIESGEQVVSASLVRDLLSRGEMEQVRKLVPDVTWAYLVERAKKIKE